MQIFLDQRHKLLLLVFEIAGVGLVLPVDCREWDSFVDSCWFFGVADAGSRRLGRFLIHRGYC